MNQTPVTLPINKHIRSFRRMTESGLDPGSGHYDVYTRTVNTDKWGGNSVNFQVANVSLDRLVVGSKCFLSLRCKASKDDGSPIVGADPIELRDGAGALAFQTMNVAISGTSVYNDTRSDITAHYYEHLANKNGDRIAGAHEHKYVGDDNDAFFKAGNTVFGTGIRKDAITDSKTFKIVKSLEPVNFFGPRDSAIPAALPITFDMVLTGEESSLFNTDDTITEPPKMFVYEIELHMYTVKMEDEFQSVIQTGLRNDTLLASADSWRSQSLGNQMVNGSTSYSTSAPYPIETVPDIFGLSFFPLSSFNSATPWKGLHKMTTSFVNADSCNMLAWGRPWRTWRNLGGDASVGSKTDLAYEMSKMSGGDEVGEGVSALSTKSFTSGKLGFFPVTERNISETSVIKPTPFSFTVNLISTGSSETSDPYIFYKLRHQWKLSAQSGQTSILR